SFQNWWPGWDISFQPFTRLAEMKWPTALYACPSGRLPRSYSANAYLAYQNWGKRTQVPQIHNTLLFVEEDETSIDNEHFACRSPDWWNMISGRHHGANLTFPDAHVEFWHWSDPRTGVFVTYFAPAAGNPDLDRLNRAQCPPFVP